MASTERKQTSSSLLSTSSWFFVDMRDANIEILYKNKRDCNDYRDLSLLYITGNPFAWILLKCLQKLAERSLLESQCGYRSGYFLFGSSKQILLLFLAVVDLTKAFDTVSRLGCKWFFERLDVHQFLSNLSDLSMKVWKLWSSLMVPHQTALRSESKLKKLAFWHRPISTYCCNLSSKYLLEMPAFTGELLGPFSILHASEQKPRPNQPWSEISSLQMVQH